MVKLDQVIKGSLEVSSNVIHQIAKPVSVFGAAPSLAQMQEMNRRSKDNKKLFRGAFFWYYFRVYYPFIFPMLFFVFMILALTIWNQIEGHLVLGSILSLIGSLSVVASYVMIIPWRKHPSLLVVYRALCSIVFSVTMILEAISANSQSCQNFAVVTQITLLAGECWLTAIASDLVRSLTNPFSSYKSNLHQYSILITLFTGFLSFIFYSDGQCQGEFDGNICWVKVDSAYDPCLWGYYLFWICLMYGYQMFAFIFAYFRLRRGLSATFEIRRKCAEETFKCLMSYAIYFSLLIFFFAVISTDPTPEPGSTMANFSMFYLFFLANRGSVDAVVWFMLHDFSRDQSGYAGMIPIPVHDSSSLSSADQVDVETPAATTTSSHDEHVHHDHHDDDDNEASEKDKKFPKKLKNTMTELADLAIAEFDENDLSPQVNVALRKQIIYYVTRGVQDAIAQKNLCFSRKTIHGIDGIMEFLMNDWKKAIDRAVTPETSVMEFFLDGEYPFRVYAGATFAQLRANEGITEEVYQKILSQPAKERLSEGASGAFMFFCGGGEYIVKTIRAREAKVLHSFLPTYVKYLQENKKSFLCRFLGSYSLQMYDQTFYFVVMLNAFDPRATINERYDIKGSWVGRSADPMKANKRTVCRHCNTYFIPSQGEQCSVIVGPHEANIVLKDNDLRTRISLNQDDTLRAIETLKKDSQLLGEIGVLDYSLLIGVKKHKFDVEITTDMMGLNENQSSENSPKSSTMTTSNNNSSSSNYNNENNHHSNPSSLAGANAIFRTKSITGPAVYHIGIIDFLQDWSTRKKLERLWKIYVLRKDPEGLSVMKPWHYMLRFQNKIDQIFDLEMLRHSLSSNKDLNRSWNADGSNSSSSSHNNRDSSRTGGDRDHARFAVIDVEASNVNRIVFRKNVSPMVYENPDSVQHSIIQEQMNPLLASSNGNGNPKEDKHVELIPLGSKSVILHNDGNMDHNDIDFNDYEILQ